MIVFSILTIYIIVKKYVTINNMENTAKLLNIFLYTKVWFHCLWFYNEVASDYSFLFSLKVLEDSLTFQLSNLAQEKKRKLRSPPKKQSAKYQSLTLLALIFKSSMYVIKIVKTKIQKHQLHFKNKILSRIANAYWNKLTKKMFKK